MAIEAVALRIVVEERFATSGLGPVCLLATELENVFDHVINFSRGQKFTVAKILGILLGPVLWIVRQHANFRATGVWIAGADAVTHGPFDIGGELGQATRYQVITGKTPLGVSQVGGMLFGNSFQVCAV